MKAVVRLILTYFTCTPLSRWLSAVGLTLIVAGSACLLYLPALQDSVGLPSALSLGQHTVLLLMPLVGVLMFFFAGAMMPLMFASFASGRLICVLPHGRLKVLASALATLTLVSVLSGLSTVVLYTGLPIDPRTVFIRTTTVMFFTYMVMYVILWWIGRSRSTIGVLGGAMLTIATLSLPVRFIASPTLPLRWPFGASLLMLTLIIVGLLFTPKLTTFLSRVRRSKARPYVPGSEVDVFLSGGRPWVLAVGQVFPILVATIFISRPSIWLFYFALFSAISGAITSFAAGRSRPLWLRTHWSRAQLFAQVEAAFWRQNCYALGVLLLLFVAVGIRSRFETSLLALGLPLLALGAATSTYLGLMMTRGMGGLEACLAVTSMILLMGTAILAAEKTNDVAVVASLESALAVIAVVCRTIAKRRWENIDWTMCRPERVARPAG